MLYIEDAKIELKCQGFEAKQIEFGPNNDKAVVFFQSTRQTKDVNCPVCNGEVHIYDSFNTELKDMPIFVDMPLSLCCFGHRYRCVKCKHTFTEEITLQTTMQPARTTQQRQPTATMAAVLQI